MTLATFERAQNSGAPPLLQDPDMAPAPRPDESKLAILEAARWLYHLPAFADRITPADMLILSQLASHLSQSQIDTGWTIVWPSVRSLVVDTPYSDRQVRISLRRLEGLGIISPVMLGRTPGYDLAGLLEVASAVHEARLDARIADGLDPAAAGTIFRLRGNRCHTEPDSNQPGRTETESDASRGQSSRRPASPAAALEPHRSTPTVPSERTGPICSPGRATSRSEASLGPTSQAETPRGVLLAARERSPTLQAWLSTADLQTLSDEHLSGLACAAYTAAIGSARRRIPQTWADVVGRQGHIGAIILAAVSLEDASIRKPSAWFGYFGTPHSPMGADLSDGIARLSGAAGACAPAHESGPDDQAVVLAPAAEAPALPASREAAPAAAGCGELPWAEIVEAVSRGQARRGGATPDVARMWLVKISVRGIVHGTLYLRARSALARDEVEKRYMTAILAEVRRRAPEVRAVVIDAADRAT